MDDSGTELVHTRCCVVWACDHWTTERQTDELARFNAHMLASAGGSDGGAPRVAPREAARVLKPLPMKPSSGVAGADVGTA